MGNKNILFLMVLATGLMMMGCGPAFKAMGFRSQTNTGIDGVVANDLVNTSSVLASTAKVQTEDGSLEWNTDVKADASGVDLQFEMKVPYGRINKLSSTLIRALIPYSCQFIPGISNSSPSSYKKGEIPCGGIIDTSWKQIVVVPVATITGEASGISYQVNGFQIPVWLARQQNSGSYDEASLDSKSIETKSSSKNIGDDISVRYTPSGTAARFEICMNIPGTTIKSTPQTISAKAWKKILGVKISYGSDFNIDPGGASFDYARGCFATDFGWQGNALAPTIAFAATEAPHLSNANYAGLDIRINDWFLNMIDHIMGWFKSSITSIAEQKGLSMVNRILDQDIESGSWFTKIHGEAMLDNTGKKLTTEISAALTRVGVPASTDDLRVMIKDSCRLMKLSGNEDWSERLKYFCENVATNIQITVEPFAVDADSKAKGCYDSFANIHNSESKWWANGCKYAARFKISLSNPNKEYQNELKLILAKRISLDRIPESWKEALKNLSVDELNLAQVLEQLENDGYSQVTADDWRSRLGSIVSQVRTSQATMAFRENLKAID